MLSPHLQGRGPRGGACQAQSPRSPHPNPSPEGEGKPYSSFFSPSAASPPSPSAPSSPSSPTVGTSPSAAAASSSSCFIADGATIVATVKSSSLFSTFTLWGRV